ALDATAHPRRSDDDHVLEVPRAARLRDPARHGGVDGRLSARCARRAAAPLRRGGGALGPVPPARALPSRARRPEARGAELQHPRHRTHPGARLMGLGTYLRNIKDAALTIADGMAATASHLVRKPFTVQYPDRLPEGVRVQDTLPFRYRGMLEVDLEICTACLACERACPIDCIVIDATKDKAAGGLVMTRFDIDMAKCMYCGLCSEACPAGSITDTTQIDTADESVGRQGHRLG